MKPEPNLQPRKRPVNLTLNQELVEQARAFTGNLSGVVESLLTDYVHAEQAQRATQIKLAEATVAAWNKFGDEHGSFADEYSTL